MPELAVAILAVPRLITLDLSIPLHVLGSRSGYRLMVCGEFMATHPLSAAATADIVVAPGGTTPSTSWKSSGPSQPGDTTRDDSTRQVGGA